MFPNKERMPTMADKKSALCPLDKNVVLWYNIIVDKF